MIVAVIGVPTAWGLARNSVGPRQIKPNAVRSSDLRNNAVNGLDVNEATLGQVPSAGNADSADHATTADSAQSADSATTADSAQSAGSANLLDGLNSTAFLRSGAKAADADKLDGIDSQLFHQTEAGGRTLVEAGSIPNDNSEVSVQLAMGTAGIRCTPTNALARYVGETVDIWTDNGGVEDPDGGGISPPSSRPSHSSGQAVSAAMTPDDRVTWFIFSATHVAEIEIVSHFAGGECRYLILANEYPR